MARRHRPMLTTRSARLSEQFGYDYAVRLFGQEAIDSLPLLLSGPNKGKRKGVLIWRKAMTAGYVPECCGPCVAGGLVDAWIGEGPGTLRDSAVSGHWIDRTQPLAGSRSVLTKEYREFELASHARARAKTDELLRQFHEREAANGSR